MAENIAHGKKAARWCDGCGTLLLGKSCSRCGSPGRIFEINSPGDIRPCFGESKTMILGLFEEAFGTSEPLEGKAIFLNKVSGEDRTDEIIAHGAVLGIARFDMRKNRMMLEIRQPGADFFNDAAKKNIVVFAGMSGHLKGKNIPGANLTDFIGEYKEGIPNSQKRTEIRTRNRTHRHKSGTRCPESGENKDFNPAENRPQSPIPAVRFS